jgi:hypothetical protein
MSFAPRVIAPPQVLFPAASANNAEEKEPSNFQRGKAIAQSSFSEMIGVLRQVEELSIHASGMFSELASAIDDTGKNIKEVARRARALEESLEKKETALENGQARRLLSAESEKGMKNKLLQLRYLEKTQQFFTPSTRGDALQGLHSESMPPPHLESMDEFLTQEDIERSGTCLARYSDPQYFFHQWVASEKSRMAEYRAEREEIRNQRKRRLEKKSTKDPFKGVTDLAWKNKQSEHVFSSRDAASKSSKEIEERRMKAAEGLSMLDKVSMNLAGKSDSPPPNARPLPPHQKAERPLHSSVAPQPKTVRTPQVAESKTPNKSDKNNSTLPTDKSGVERPARAGALPPARPTTAPGSAGMPSPPPLPSKLLTPNIRPAPKAKASAAPAPDVRGNQGGLPSFLQDVQKFKLNKLKESSAAPAPDAGGSQGGLPSFLQDVQKFKLKKLKKVAEEQGNGGAESRPRNEDRKVATEKPRNLLMEAIRTRQAGKVTVDDIENKIQASKVRRKSSIEQTGVAAILAHRIKIFGGEESDDGTSGSDSDWSD